MAKKKQSVQSDVSTVAEALSKAAEVTPIRPRTVNKLASNNPVTPKGYTSLGPGGPPHTGKALPEKSKDNRGEGSA